MESRFFKLLYLVRSLCGEFSVVVQWLGLRAFINVVWVPSLVIPQAVLLGQKKPNSGIYLVVNQPSFFNLNNSLYDVCYNAIKNNIPVEQRAFYVDGVDYTTKLMQYCMTGLQSDWLDAVNESDPDPDRRIYLHGVPVDQELMTILQTITMKRYQGVEKSWLTMCYYYVTLSA